MLYHFFSISYFFPYQLIYYAQIHHYRVADKYEHNMWDYVYYSLYLDSIDTGDHNAIQKYVYELVSMVSYIACLLSTV